MAGNKGTPVRFSLLTVLVWLLVAGGVIFLLWEIINRISARNVPFGTPTPNLTQAYQTISAVLTAQPSSTSTENLLTTTPSPSSDVRQTPPNLLPSPQTSATQGEAAKTATLTRLCDQAAAGNPIDVTIPDDSLISPGQSFTKTWKLVNAGTCTWTTAYTASFFYGDHMGAPDSVALPENVLPAHSVEISVEMEAPLAPGAYQGNWKLANPAGVLFGIGPDGVSPFWVRIVVAENLTATATATPGPSVTITPTGATTTTPTPNGQLSAELTLVPGDSIDLDTLTLNSGNVDLAYQLEANHYHWLAPQLMTMIGVFGNQQPDLDDCQATNMSSAPIAVESLSLGTYLCYHSEEGRYGRMMLLQLNPNTFALTVDLLTWALP